MVDRGVTRPAAAEQPHVDADAGRGDGQDMIAERGEDPVRVLIGHEAAADLGVGVGRDDRLAALALEPAPQAVDVERRPGAASFEGRIAGLAVERGQAEAREIRRLVERQVGDQGALLGAQLDHVVVEARDEDPAVLVLEPGDDPGEGVRGIVDRAAVAARMEVDRRPRHVDLGVHHPAQGDRDRRCVALEEPRIADQREIGREALAVGAQPGLEIHRARLLLALEDVAHVHRKLAAGREERLGRPQMEVELALVVGHAPTEDPVADDDGLERRRGPELERVDRLDVVMAVDDHRRRALGVEPVAVDHGRAAGLRHLDMLDPDPLEVRGERRAGSRRRAAGGRRCSGSG